MGATFTDNGAALGAGSVEGRYVRRMVQGIPEADDIPHGCWAVKNPESELWDLVTSREADGQG